MVSDFKFKISGEKININVKKCESLYSQISGLMFKKNSLPLLFIFKKEKSISIHSFFCKTFIAIWFANDKIIDMMMIKPNKFSIKPKEKFNKLLEIPSNYKEFKKICDFIDGQEHLNTKSTSINK